MNSVSFIKWSIMVALCAFAAVIYNHIALASFLCFLQIALLGHFIQYAIRGAPKQKPAQAVPVEETEQNQEVTEQ